MRSGPVIWRMAAWPCQRPTQTVGVPSGAVRKRGGKGGADLRIAMGLHDAMSSGETDEALAALDESSVEEGECGLHVDGGDGDVKDLRERVS